MGSAAIIIRLASWLYSAAIKGWAASPVAYEGGEVAEEFSP